MSPFDYRAINDVYSAPIYSISKAFQALALNTLWRRKIYGRENIPPPGTPTLFASNHRSLSDPSNVGSCVPYPIFFFAKEELFKIPVLGWGIRRVNAFPVKRGEHDVGAFKTALKVLDKGGGLLVFPEGGRRLDPKRQWKAKAGVGLLACKTGARIVPVGVTHAESFTKLAPLVVRFGEAFYPPAHPTAEDYQNVADETMRRIKELCHE